MKKKCTQCGNSIDSEDLFCIACGAKVELNQKIYNETSTSKDKTEDGFNIQIPFEHHFCSYCGKVKPNNEFRVLFGSEYCMCNKCYKREENIKYVTCLIPVVFYLVTIITIYIIYREFTEGLITTIVAGFFYTPLLQGMLFYLVVNIFKFTPLRTRLSSYRKKWLSQLKDSNGNSIINPMVRSDEEKIYYQYANVYLDRDIPYNCFRCPCCDKIYLISTARSIDNEDNDYRSGGSLIGGSYTKITTTEYTTLICKNCYWYKKIEFYIKVVTPLVTLLVVLIVGIFFHDWSWRVLLGTCFGSLLAGGFLGFILSFIYKEIIYLVCRKNLFIFLSKVAENGAIRPRRKYNS